MDTSRVFLEAIARRRCVGAIYNRGDLLIAPHILYTRHGDMFVDAATVERDGQPPREVKLGTFKLAGLREPRVIDKAFEPDPSFDRDAERYDGVTLFAVEPN